MTVLLVLFATLLAGFFLIVMFVNLTVHALRFRAVTIGLLAGILTSIGGGLFANYGAPVIRILIVPLNVAAIAIALACTKDDWKSFTTAPLVIPADLKRDSLTVVVGVIGAFIGVESSVGKPLLLLLGRDVIGDTAEELLETGVAGAVIGFLTGAFAMLYIWAWLCKVFGSARPDNPKRP